MDTMECIRTRRSIRKYADRPVDPQIIQQVLEAACWAPSGLNNQPWRFMVITDKSIKEALSGSTKYGSLITGADTVLAVFLDKKSSYNYLKDAQAIGSCIQNMLLAAHASGIGACWIGEILNQAEKVCGILSVSADHELMAVVTLGYPAEAPDPEPRFSLDDLILKSPE